MKFFSGLSFFYFRANEEIDKARTSSTAEIARLQAALKKSELRASSLESTLEQKVMLNSVKLSCIHM